MIFRYSHDYLLTDGVGYYYTYVRNAKIQNVDPDILAAVNEMT